MRNAERIANAANGPAVLVVDASGGTSKEAHDCAMRRTIQAGVVLAQQAAPRDV